MQAAARQGSQASVLPLVGAVKAVRIKDASMLRPTSPCPRGLCFKRESGAKSGAGVCGSAADNARSNLRLLRVISTAFPVKPGLSAPAGGPSIAPFKGGERSQAM
jgi:hypothetical protein